MIPQIYVRNALQVRSKEKIELCTNYCLTIWGRVGEIHDESGKSGMWMGRPKLKALLSKARAGEFGALVIPNIEALSRSPVYAALVVQEFIEVGVTVHCASSHAPFQLPILLDNVLLERPRANAKKRSGSKSC